MSNNKRFIINKPQRGKRFAMDVKSLYEFKTIEQKNLTLYFQSVLIIIDLL